MSTRLQRFIALFCHRAANPYAVEYAENQTCPHAVACLRLVMLSHSTGTEASTACGALRKKGWRAFQFDPCNVVSDEYTLEQLISLVLVV